MGKGKEGINESEKRAYDSERRLRAIIDNASDGIITIDQGGLIQTFSPAAERIFGYKTEELIGRNVSMLMPQQIACQHDDYLARYLAGESAGIIGSNREVRGRRANGEEFPMDLAVGKTEIGNELIFTGIIRDISARKQAQAELVQNRQELQRQNDLLQTVLGSMSQGIVAFDRDKRLIAWNEKFFRLHDFPMELAYTGCPLEAFLPDDWVDEGSLDAAPVVLLTGTFDQRTERQLENGRIVEIFSDPLPNGGFVSTFTDISTARAAADALTESEERGRLILNAAGEGIIGLDINGEVSFVNSAACTMLGYEMEELLGQSLHEVAHHAHADGTPYAKEACRMLAAMRSGISTRIADEVLWRKDGTCLPVEYICTPVMKGGEIISSVVSIRDISERIASEKSLQQYNRELERARDNAEAAARTKASFLAAMSHEIRTPMNGVLGMIDLLRETQLDVEQRKMMRTVRDSAYSLLQIIDDILDFSKIEAGKLKIEQAPFSLQGMVEGVVMTLLHNAQKKDLSLQLFIDPQIPSQLKGDQVRVRQILFNLVGNAIKFSETTETRRGQINILVESVDAPDKATLAVRFSVIDNGIGMTETQQRKLFIPFSQAESSTTRRFGGTGLGLTISKNLSDLMQGSIEVNSRFGVGSTFVLTLPFAIENADLSSDWVDLSGIQCLVAIEAQKTCNDVASYLRHWNNTPSFCLTPDAIEAELIRGAQTERPYDVLLLGPQWNYAQQCCLVDRLRCQVQTRYVLLSQDTNAPKGIVTPDMVVIEAAPLLPSAFDHGLAIAMGRASPYVEDTLVVRPSVLSAPTIEEAQSTGQLILLAEDNLTNQDVIRRQLAILGYACEIAEDGRQALRMVEQRRHALLLTDCHMPIMDGYDLTRRIRAREEGTSDHLPIIAVTANALQGEGDRCLRCGMDAYLSKPLEMSKLKVALKHWMPTSLPPDKHEEETVTKPAANSDLPIDLTYLQQTFGEDDDFIREILKDYLAPTQEMIQQIEAAYLERDAQTIGATAHKLKSSSRAIGAIALADLCQALELAGKSENWTEVEPLYDSLHTVLESVLACIESL